MRRGTNSEFDPLAPAVDPPTSDDFLLHLSRGAEYLGDRRVLEGQVEIGRALAYQPQDAQAQDLLAGVYFHLGMYDTAIARWESLVEGFPDDPTLRVNLGLALLKTGQPLDAREQLQRALELAPDHARAWAYLGLALWRHGDPKRAREAFLNGNQPSMARRMEEVAARRGGGLRSEVTDAQVSALRDAAAEAIEHLDLDGALGLDEDAGLEGNGAWRVLETGRVSEAPTPEIQPPVVEPGPLPTVTSLVQGWSVAFPSDGPMAVGPHGELLLRSPGAMHFRPSSLLALLPSAPPDRSAAMELEAALPKDPLQRWPGPVSAVVAAPAEGRFHCARLHGSRLVVRGRHVEAFDDRVQLEILPPIAGSSGEPLFAFEGDGAVALRFASEPVAVPVTGGLVHVRPERVLGWMGRLVPSFREHGAYPSSLAFRGRGVVLLS